MINANQIRDIVRSYLSVGDGERFMLALGEASYNIHKNGDAEAIKLVGLIRGKIADLHGNCISFSAFRDSLRQLALPLVDATYVVHPITSGSNNYPLMRLGEMVGFAEEPSVLFANRQPALAHES